MAFTETDIRVVHAEEVKREKIPLSGETRAGVQHHYWNSTSNPGRQTFKRPARRKVPDFTGNLGTVKHVVAQAAYSRVRIGRRWQKVPDDIVNSPGSLTAALNARVRRFNNSYRWRITPREVKEHVAILSAVAYLGWRMMWKRQDIAEYLQVPLYTVAACMVRLRNAATRLGYPVPRNKKWKGDFSWRIDPALHHEHRSAAQKAAWARMGQERRDQFVAIMHSPEARAKRKTTCTTRASAISARWKDPDYRARVIASIKRAKNSPEGKKRCVDALKKAWAENHDQRAAKFRTSFKAAWQDPAKRGRLLTGQKEAWAPGGIRRTKPANRPTLKHGQMSAAMKASWTRRKALA